MSSENIDADLQELVDGLPEGWSRHAVDGQTWQITRTTRADGRVITLEAERLGDHELLGANVWITSGGPVLRPCEVPAAAVMSLLRATAQAAAGPQAASDTAGDVTDD